MTTTPGRREAEDWLLKSAIHPHGTESARRDFARRTVDRILALVRVEPDVEGAEARAKWLYDRHAKPDGWCDCEFPNWCLFEAGYKAALAEQPREDEHGPEHHRAEAERDRDAALDEITRTVNEYEKRTAAREREVERLVNALAREEHRADVEQARAEQAEGEVERLREGMREQGFTVGRNPDGVDDTVDAALLVVRDAMAELRRLREGLRELVRLKDLKEAGEDLAWTEAEKQAAWQAARAALKEDPR